MNTELLKELYTNFNIANLPYGIVHDKLGDVYEAYCIKILTCKEFLIAIQKETDLNSVEFRIFKTLFNKASFINIKDIKEIKATNQVPHRQTRGNAKTDVIATILYQNGDEVKLPISSKQSYVQRVAVAEFDVNTICREAEINNDRIKELMLKFQTAHSAKGLTESEKQELGELIKPYSKQLVRWAITGSPKENPADIIFPKLIVKFRIQRPKDRYKINVADGDLQYKDCSIYTINEYIDMTMLNKNGKNRTGGFGTGLSWTYASGSGGRKIQFKA